MTDHYEPIPPRTDRYEKAWEVIDRSGGLERVSSIDCITTHLMETYKTNKPTTRNKYRGELLKFDRIIKERGHNPLPWTINEAVVKDLLEVVWKDKAVATKKWYAHILNRYLKFYGNRAVENLDLQWPQDMRPNVHWLTDQQYATLLTIQKTPLEELIVALELGMGLRSVEVCRLRLCDIHKNSPSPSIQVRGKGRGEGKWRTVPFGNGFNHALEMWMEERSKIVARMHLYDPGWIEPEELVIWSHYVSKPAAGPYSERGNSLNRGPIAILNEKVGFKFTQHTLRRTFGRRLFHAGVPLESISKILGHEDAQTTYKYLGLNMDDMTSAFDKLREFDNRLL